MIRDGAYWKIVYQYEGFPPSQRHSSEEDGTRPLLTCKLSGYGTLRTILCETSSHH
jgi:hypothetical protein